MLASGLLFRSTCTRRDAGSPVAEPAPDPSPRSRGRTGTRNDAAPRFDWQGLQAAGDVRHTADANDEDTAFTGGSKEDVPGEWDFRVETDGVRPGKANIRDAWAAVDQDGADTFVYLGFARDSAVAVRRRRSSRLSSTTTRASGTTGRR